MPTKWLQERADGSKNGHVIGFEGPGVGTFPNSSGLTLGGLCFPDSFPSFSCLVMSLRGFAPITISQPTLSTPGVCQDRHGRQERDGYAARLGPPSFPSPSPSLPPFLPLCVSLSRARSLSLPIYLSVCLSLSLARARSLPPFRPPCVSLLRARSLSLLIYLSMCVSLSRALSLSLPPCRVTRSGSRGL